MATRDQKLKAYNDAVEITKAAYSSQTGYRGDAVADFLQRTYDKLVELMDDVAGQEA